MVRKKRACDSCHRRKIQCDGVLPQCNFCFHHDVACTFTRILGARKRSPKTSGNSDKDLARRIERIELALDAAQKNLAARILESRDGEDSLTSSPNSSSHQPGTQNNEPVTTSSNNNKAKGQSGQGLSPISSSQKARSAARPQSSNFGTLHFAGFHVGEISSYNGIPFFSPNGQNWIRSRTGQDPSFERLFAAGPPWHTAQHAQLPLMPGNEACNTNWDLPDRQFVETCVSAYCSSSFGHAFPIIEAASFQSTLALAYEQEGSSWTLEATGAKACIFSLMSYMYRSRKEHIVDIDIDGEGFAAKAWLLIPQVMHQSSVTSFQTLFMLAMSHFFAGDFQQGTNVLALSCRILYALGAHSQPSQQSTTNNSVYRAERNVWLESHLRQLFWMAYTLDKEVSLRTGQPPSIEDDFCDLTLPRAHRSPQPATNTDDGSTYIEEGRPDLTWMASWTATLPGDLRLTIIKSKTCRVLYSTAALRKSDAQLLRDIRELDEELERWRCSVPLPFRPALAFSEDMPGHNFADLEQHLLMKRSITHFEYHYLAAAIHRASGRCSVWAGGEGVSSSVAITVQASRSTLIYLRAAAEAIADTAFWLLVFYPMSAILTIFCNILLDPFDPQAEEDLDLLCTVPSLIRAMRKGPLTPKEIAYFEEVDDFFAELTRLGRCAIDRVSPARDGDSSMELD